MQRSSEERNAAADRLAARKSGNSLVYDSLEDRSRKVGAGSALIDERLDVRFRKYAAARRDGVDL